MRLARALGPSAVNSGMIVHRLATSVGGSRQEGLHMGSVIKKRRKRMAKKKHRKLLRKTRVARRKAGK